MTGETEDYRVKNAREGKAIYIPGKTVEEMAAQSAKSKAGKAQSETSPDLLTAIRASMAEIDTLANDVQWHFSLVTRNLVNLRFAIAEQPIGDEGDLTPLIEVLRFYAETRANTDCAELITKIMAVERLLKEVDQNALKQ